MAHEKCPTCGQFFRSLAAHCAKLRRFPNYRLKCRQIRDRQHKKGVAGE